MKIKERTTYIVPGDERTGVIWFNVVGSRDDRDVLFGCFPERADAELFVRAKDQMQADAAVKSLLVQAGFVALDPQPDVVIEAE